MSFTDKYKAKATTAPVFAAAGFSPEATFIKKVQQQITIAGDAIKNNLLPSGSTAWFKQSGAGFKTKLMRSPLIVDGVQWWAFNSLEEVISFYNDVIVAVKDGDESLVKPLVARAAENKDEAAKKFGDARRGPKKK